MKDKKMIKNREQLAKEYDWGISFLEFYINASFMSARKDETNPYKNYSDLAKAVIGHYINRGEKKTLEILENIIIDLKSIAQKELASWQIISSIANTCLDGPEDAKKWLLEEVLPPLIAEAEKRGWKKPV